MKNKTIALVYFILALMLSVVAEAAGKTDSLEDQLKSLDLPANTAPAAVSEEKLYSIQNRFVPLSGHHEIEFAGGRNVSSSFLDSEELSLAYRYYFTEKIFLAAGGSYVFNSLSSSAQRLYDTENVVADEPFVNYRAEMLAGYNLFYGKIRFGMQNVYYFDQYVALGPAMMMMNSGNSLGAAGDIGFAVWAGQQTNIRIGVKDYLYNAQSRLNSGLQNDVIAHLDVGFLFGGKDI